MDGNIAWLPSVCSLRKYPALKGLIKMVSGDDAGQMPVYPRKIIHLFSSAIVKQKRGKEQFKKSSWGEIMIRRKHFKGKIGSKLEKI